MIIKNECLLRTAITSHWLKIPNLVHGQWIQLRLSVRVLWLKSNIHSQCSVASMVKYSKNTHIPAMFNIFFSTKTKNKFFSQSSSSSSSSCLSFSESETEISESQSEVELYSSPSWSILKRETELNYTNRWIFATQNACNEKHERIARGALVILCGTNNAIGHSLIPNSNFKLETWRTRTSSIWFTR